MQTHSELAELSILIVEDDSLLRNQITAYLAKLGSDITGVKDVQGAREVIQHRDFDFVLLDVNLPDGLGTALLKENAFPASTGVIVMTAEGDVSGAVEAVRLGAVDFLVKPFDIPELTLVIGRARRVKQSARRDEHRRDAEVGHKIDFFFGESLAPLEAQLEKILAADRRMQTALPPVLIQGETGTGKSTIARWVHYQGPRAALPLVEVNCSAFPEHLAESELFGHERGAFTDARAARLGLFEAANGGTLFLDELPSLPLPVQAKILTAIEDKTIRRVGGNRQIFVDVRLIAAANRDLKTLVAEKLFREDLYHRLDLWQLHIPPLRERSADILMLANLLLERICKRHRLPLKKIHPDAIPKLLGYSWPGNVRELAHELERAVIFDQRDELKFNHLPSSLETDRAQLSENGCWFNEQFQFPPQFSIEEAIGRTIERALKQTGHNVSAAARLLGVPRDYVRYRVNKSKVGKSPVGERGIN